MDRGDTHGRAPEGRAAQAGGSCAAAETVGGSLHLRGLRDGVQSRRRALSRRGWATTRRILRGGGRIAERVERVTTLGALFPNLAESPFAPRLREPDVER
ncbi:hypothetical protein P355_2219 [Burkholderia cenocepacia KC-01]|nr:hypothetical protein P355_2219 [Burkholderia cenocepacia KC-01]